MDLHEMKWQLDQLEERVQAVELRARALLEIERRSTVCTDAATFNWGGRHPKQGNPL